MVRWSALHTAPLVLALLLLAALPGGWAGFPPPNPHPYETGDVLPAPAVEEGCPPAFTCLVVDVDCPDLQEVGRASLAIAAPLDNLPALPRGLGMFFSGGGGTGWWGGSQAAAGFFEQLLADGFLLVQVRWHTPWLAAAEGELVGPSHLACRPASLVPWVHQHLFPIDPLAQQGLGGCGFCITGNSGGASQVSYALSHYALQDWLDGVFPSGGPPHAALVKGCLRNPGEEAYWFEPNSARTIDRSYGFLTGDGPCERHDAAFHDRWLYEAVDTSGSRYSYAITRLHFLFGTADATVGPQHGLDYAARTLATGSPMVEVEWMPGVPHNLASSPEGLAALRGAMLGAP